MLRKNIEQREGYLKYVIGILAVISLVLLYVLGVKEFFFYQDDVISLAMVVSDWPRVLLSPNAEHLNTLTFMLFRAEWFLFGVRYSGYLAVSIGLFAILLGVIYKIVLRETRSGWLATVAAGLLVINRNWGEMLWWVTGQAMLLSTLLSVVSFGWILRLERKRKVEWWERGILLITLILPSLAWGSGLVWPVAVVLGWGWKRIRGKVKVGYLEAYLAVIVVFLMYYFIARGSVGINFEVASWGKSPAQIFVFVAVLMVENILARWIWPFKNWAVANSLLLIAGIWLFWSGWIKRIAWRREVIFCFVVAIVTMFGFALPRWQFGLGQAMAERYSFLPLIFGVMGVALGFSKVKWAKREKVGLLGIVIYVTLVGWIGFWKKAESWSIRPKQTREWFNKIESTQQGECLANEYLPKFIVGVDQKRWRTEFVWPLFKKDFEPFCE